MTPTRYYLDTLYRCTKADWDLFQRWTDFLPRRSDGEPYHSGPHNLHRFRMVYEMLRPKHVLEVGFNLGHSAVIWLELGVNQVTSIQNTCGAKQVQACKAIGERYGGEHRFLHTDSLNVLKDPTTYQFIAGIRFDLAFIDGSHERDWVKRDINLATALEIPYLLMDDYDGHHGPGVVEAVEDKGLVPLAIFGTMCLCRQPGLFTKRADPMGSNYYE